MKQEVLEFIMEKAQKLCFEEITLDTVLFDVGMNSLNAISLIVDLERHFSIKFNDEELSLFNIKTPRKLIEIVEEKVNSI